jgi:hypothetical protein
VIELRLVRGIAVAPDLLGTQQLQALAYLRHMAEPRPAAPEPAR